MRGSRRFVRPWMTTAERLDLMISHYTFLVDRFSSAGLAALLDKSGVQLVVLTGKSGKKYIMKMTGEMSKDGCIRIILIDPDNTRLASITGVIGKDKNNEKVFWVGALQGGTPLSSDGTQASDGKKPVADATKDLNGLRPKQAVLHAVCAVSMLFGVKKILAPSLKNQIAIKNWRKGGNIHTEYDTFWDEYTEGKTDSHGDYSLTLPLPRRRLEDVQQKRRKDWVLRYGRVDEMTAGINKALDSL